jgi:membrane protease YdiL (CAAX protease family)
VAEPAGVEERSTVRGPGTGWQVVSALEVVAAGIAVVLDLWLPTLVLLAMAGLSLLGRRAGPRTLGLRAVGGPALVVKMLGFAAVWSLFQLGVTMPLAERLSGQRQDLSAFDDLQGDLGMLAGLLLLSWTLAAFGEEMAYRGYLLTRLCEALGGGRAAVVAGVLVSSVLFGIAHTEQGVVGIGVVALDGVAWSVLRIRYGTVWAAVLAHGFNNTLGFLTFFLVGPVHGLW